MSTQPRRDLGGRIVVGYSWKGHGLNQKQGWSIVMAWLSTLLLGTYIPILGITDMEQMMINVL